MLVSDWPDRSLCLIRKITERNFILVSLGEENEPRDHDHRIIRAIRLTI